MNNKKGFTLIELLVVVLIIGILAAMALPQYFKAVERSRMGEAVQLLANIAQAQQRKYLQINKYTANYKGLDVAPKGATGASYYTKGDPTAGTGGNGFRIDLDDTAANLTTFQNGAAGATRHSANGALQYAYTLHRYYAGSGTACRGGLVDVKNAAANLSGGAAATAAAVTNGAALCADFCGLDELADNTWCCSDGGATVDTDVSKLAGACKQPNAIDGSNS